MRSIRNDDDDDVVVVALCATPSPDPSGIPKMSNKMDIVDLYRRESVV